MANNGSRRSLWDRFHEKISPEPNSGCWLWTGATLSGYGKIGLGGHDGPTRSAHRVSWELYRGVIPGELQICHKCDVKTCVNPDHLFLGTQKENLEDCKRKGRVRKFTKLSAKDVLEIRSSQLTTIKLASLYGVAQSNISLIKRGKSWRSLTGDSDAREA